MKKLIVIINLFFVFTAFGQDIDYARKIIDTLCSPYFHGRGYVQNGDKLTAAFIADELKKFQKKKFNDSYFQPFEISINTFPSPIHLEIDNTALSPGIDFLIDPSSGSCKGSYEIEWLYKDNIENNDSLTLFLRNNHKNKFVVVDTSGVGSKDYREQIKNITGLNLFNAKGIIEVTKKLTYGTSQKNNNFPTIQLKKDVIDRNNKFITLYFRNKFIKNYETQNVIGYLDGETDTFIVFTAHYDHLGMMGDKVYFPGANDNASGVSMVLNLAKYYASLNKKLHYSIAFIFFSAEDVRLLGSKYFSEHPLFPLEKIKFFSNLDLVGTGDDGIKVVNGSVLKKEFDLLVSINNEMNLLKLISPRGEAANSDHYYFYSKGVKSIFIYTLGGISEYHSIFDKAETLPLTEYEDLFRLLITFVERYE
ncbi:MAG: M28 family peptidase [Bacteroidota bacterium]